MTPPVSPPGSPGAPSPVPGLPGGGIGESPEELLGRGWLGDSGQGVLNTEVICPGAAFRYAPGTVHRVTALEDLTILEVSTPHLDDVVRLEDAYGREGTSAP